METAKLSIIVPVFNEEPHLEAVIVRMMESKSPIEREWIFVDDSSTDGSLATLQKCAERFGFRVIELGGHGGKGAAVRRGFQEATGNFMMIQDADFEYDPNDVPQLLQPMLDGKVDVVYGSRFKKNSAQVHRTYHYFSNRILTSLSNLLSGIYLTDNHTCYKIFRSDLIRSMNLKSEGFEIDIELTAYIAKIRPRIFELPISYYPRTRLQGKKINWKDGVAALYYLFRFNTLTSPSRAFHEVPVRYLNAPLMS